MNCNCNGRMNNQCAPQQGGLCPSHLCNVHLGGPISKSRDQSKWTDDPITDRTNIKLQHINELRNALRRELSVRGLEEETWKDPGNYFSAEQWLQIKDAINRCKKKDGGAEYVYIDPYNIGGVITPLGMQYFRLYVNQLQTVCICDCNYDCSCNCDYCECNCNYCTCQCNWWCRCNCAY